MTRDWRKRPAWQPAAGGESRRRLLFPELATRQGKCRGDEKRRLARIRPFHASAPPLERPNIYKLYEENIGPLTPLIADALKDAEAEYPPEWIEEALGEAVKRNKRNWKYVEAILRGWKEEGRGKEQNRQNAEELRGRDVEKLVEEFRKRPGK